MITKTALYDKEAEEQAMRESKQAMKSRRHSIGHIIDSGDVDDALVITADWLKEAPEDVDARNYHAQALALAGKYEDAIKEIDFVINYVSTAKDKWRFVNPYKGDKPLIQKGTYQTGLGNYAEALKTLSEAFPKTLNADDYLYRAKAEIGMGRQKDGCADLEEAVKLYFNDARIVRRDEAAKLLEETKTKLHS